MSVATVKRFPVKSDFAFLAPLWDLVKNSRNGLLCGDKIPEMMKANGFTKSSDRCAFTELEFDAWSHSDFYGTYTIYFDPVEEVLFVCKDGDAWETDRDLKILSPQEFVYASQV